MMDGATKQRRDNQSQRRSQNKKPPSGILKPSPNASPSEPLKASPRVPNSWEIEFCKVVGSMDWDDFLQKKNDLHFYPRLMEWNDIAGEEAFNNAKRRFWSQRYGISCYVPLPDPDLYINHIDWDLKIDEIEFSQDLDSISLVCDVTEEDDKGPEIFGDPFAPETYQAIQPTGWGDDDDAPAVTFTASYGDLLGSY